MMKITKVKIQAGQSNTKKNTIALWTKQWAKEKNQEYVFYSQTSSTNDKAKEYPFNKQKKQPILFIAGIQTGGRGRRNKKWLHSDMMVSWSYLLTRAPQPVTTKLMGQALAQSLKKTWPNCPFKIKEPNDIYIKGKKSAGLLIEVVNKGPFHRLVVGTGLNVFSHPASFTHLREHIPSLTKKQWARFLDEWRAQIEQKIALCLKPST